MSGKFSVYQFFPDGQYECVRSNVDAKAACDAAHSYSHSVGARIGTTARITIVDGDDFIVFEWLCEQGVVFPPELVRSA